MSDRTALIATALVFSMAFTLAQFRPARSQSSRVVAHRSAARAEFETRRRGLTAARPLPLAGSGIVDTTTLTNGDYVATTVRHEAPRQPLHMIGDSDEPPANEAESVRITLHGRVVFSRTLAAPLLRRAGGRLSPAIILCGEGASRRVLIVAPSLEIRYEPAVRAFVAVSRTGDLPSDVADMLASGYHRTRVSTWKSIEARVDERGFFSAIHPDVRRLEVRIDRQGRVVFDSVDVADRAETATYPFEIWNGPTFVRLARGEPPTIMLTGYTDGAHCCLISRMYAARERGAIHGEEAFWGDVGTGPHFAYDDRSGRFIIVYWEPPGDYPLLEKGPLEMWSFERDHLRNVTQSFVDLVRLQAEADFNVLRSDLRTRADDPQTNSLERSEELANAYIEDEYVAGEGRKGRRRFEALRMSDADRRWLTFSIDRYRTLVEKASLIDARW